MRSIARVAQRPFAWRRAGYLVQQVTLLNQASRQGVLFFRPFLLDKQKKGTRPQPRSGGAKQLNLWILAFARMTKGRFAVHETAQAKLEQ